MNAPPVTRATRSNRGVQRPCAICGQTTRDSIAFGVIRPSLATRLLASHPKLAADHLICRKHLTEQRSRYVEELLEHERGEIPALERQVVESLGREEIIARNTETAWAGKRTRGEQIADFVADFGGSSNFILGFMAFLLVWIAINIWAVHSAFAPLPIHPA